MIEVDNLHKKLGLQKVLCGTTFSIETGEAVVIIGKSGGGKSVLLKHLIGLMTPDSGHVRVNGEDLACLDERSLLRVRRQFGMLFQNAALFDSMTVFENVSFLLRRERRQTDGEMRRLVTEALEMVELGGIEQKMPGELSGGMRKRVGLARAIIHRPNIVFYDEPTTGLDPIGSARIDQLVRRVWGHLRVTSIAVTHDMKSARTISDRILMLQDGEIYADGRTSEILSSADPVVNHFVNGIAETQLAPVS